MRIVKFEGGLGNQMFQYAFYRALKRYSPGLILADLRSFKFSTEHHNGYELSRLFNVKLDYTLSSFTWYDIVNKLTGKKSTLREEGIGVFNSGYLTCGNHVVYVGFWQTEKYFQPVEKAIRNDFRFQLPLSERNQSMMEMIRTSHSVSVHVRRGDYLKFSNTQNICTLDYYRKSMEQIRLMKGNDVSFFIFSDDINWCKENLPVQPSTCFVDYNSGMDSYADMQLMSNCKHNIIANSSFSWWGAWLNDNPDKTVIAPSGWFSDGEQPDLVPDSWIRI